MQLALDLPPAKTKFRHGGARPGAGRPAKKRKPGDSLPHVARPKLDRHKPMHVTLRVARGVPSLEKELLRNRVRRALRARRQTRRRRARRSRSFTSRSKGIISTWSSRRVRATDCRVGWQGSRFVMSGASHTYDMPNRFFELGVVRSLLSVSELQELPVQDDRSLELRGKFARAAFAADHA